MVRSPKGSGLQVDPGRVRQARLDARLSLGEVAGDDFSRTFLLFVEQGKSRPSKRILQLIARRTGKPMKYFLQSVAQPTTPPGLSGDLVSQLAGAALSARRFVSESRLSKSEREAMVLIEVNLHQAAILVRSISPRRLTKRKVRAVDVASAKA